MANTSSRTLRLLTLLQTHRYWPGTELAGRLEVSARTLRRDVDRLRELGYPVNAARGVDGGYQLAAGAVLPPLVVDDEKAVALAVGLRAAAQGGIAGIEEAAVSALTKIVQVMPPRLRKRVDTLRAVTMPAVWGDGPSIDPDVLTIVAQACRDEERLEFGYLAASGERTERQVEPHRLVSLGRRWYLVAYDLMRADWRSFRLDRLDQPRSTGQRFRPRELPARDAAAYVRTGLGNIATPYTIEAVVHAPAATVLSAIGQWATVTEIDDASARVVMSANALEWGGLALGSVGAEFKVLGPPEMVEMIREWGARFTRSTTA